VSEPSATPPLVAVALTTLPSMVQPASALAPNPVRMPLADAIAVQFALAEDRAPPSSPEFALLLAVAFALPEEAMAEAVPPLVPFAEALPPELPVASAKAFLIATACALP